ncbi:hypothetical protein GCM10010211_31520 [Streptomyces albospinus]|uniref:FecR protein domain-containing protein n=1 Tax=Streptomyces albospinus TaxID=285515 RepID=A0ABQ2V215_9ACTN|nr:hypothetical protein [Streptomyces albospinus]GGU64091.1 hypothetical protein GCM10010211_31520 [Streptomyces albospinus]
MKTSRISPASRTSLRALCTAAVLAGAMAVPTTVFAAGTLGQQERPASDAAPQTPAKGKVRAVDIGGGMEAVIHNGVCDLQSIGSGKPFATLKKGESYTKGILVYFDGRHVSARTQGRSSQEMLKPGPARTVVLANGARATVQKVNGSYTAKIQVKDKRIATLSSTHRSVTHEGMRYTVNPKDGKVAVERLKKRQGLHGTKHRVIHARAQHRSLPQRHFQRPVTSYAQTPAASPAQPTANYATYASPAQMPVTGQAQMPVAGQAQMPVTGQAQTPMYGGGWTHRSRHGAQAGAMSMSFSSAAAGGGR